jgi:hypothetical protein
MNDSVIFVALKKNKIENEDCAYRLRKNGAGD